MVKRKTSRKNDPYGLASIDEVSKTSINAVADIAKVGMVTSFGVYGINAFSNLIKQ